MIYSVNSFTNFTGVDLFTFVSERCGIPEIKALEIFSQLVKAVAYCHQAGVVHLDIKLDNVIYNRETGKAVLIDFGLCKFIEGDDTFDNIGGSFEYEFQLPPNLIT